MRSPVVPRALLMRCSKVIHSMLISIQIVFPRISSEQTACLDSLAC
jgi:hypothetical protein